MFIFIRRCGKENILLLVNVAWVKCSTFFVFYSNLSVYSFMSTNILLTFIVYFRFMIASKLMIGMST